MPDFIVDFGLIRSALTAREWLADFWQTIISWVQSVEPKHSGQDDNLVNILGMVGVAILTVMIPIAVAIFGKESERGKYVILDRHAMLDYVVNAKWLLWFIVLVYTPLVLWEFFPVFWELQLVYFTAWVFGVGGMMFILRGAYRWIKGEKFEARKKYLQKLSASGKLDDMKKSWHSVWEVKGANLSDERDFFKIFAETVTNLLNDNKFTAAAELAIDFNRFADNRSTDFFVFSEGAFPEILKLHFLTWGKEKEIPNYSSDAYHSCAQLSEILSDSVEKVGERALSEGRSYSFFPILESHMEKYVPYAGRDDSYYINDIIFRFFRTLEKSVENKKFHTIHWKIFPFKWEISMENITSEKNYISRFLADVFFNWADRRLFEEGVPDDTLGDFLYNLFPRVNNRMWAMILDFLMGNWLLMEFLVERRLKFSSAFRFQFPRWTPNREGELNVDDQEKETIALALYFFEDKFPENKINEWIDELKSMAEVYSGEDKEFANHRRKEYLRIFEAIREEVKRRAENAAGYSDGL